MQAVSKADRLRGTLLGLAWGDVLGCPMEGWMKPEIERVFGAYTELPIAYPLTEIAVMDAAKLKRLRPLGLHSDDTQQALALINVCLAEAGWSPETWGRTLVEGLRMGAWRGFGRNFSSAVHKIKKGATTQTAGSSSAGIGSAMRIAPLGALFHDNPNQLAQVVMESSLVTHGDIRAASLSYAVAWTVAEFCNGSDAPEITQRLPDAVEIVEREWLNGHSEWLIDRSAGTLVSNVMRTVFSALDSDYAVRCKRLSELAKPHLADGFTKAHPNQGFVLLGGLHALQEALLCDADPRAALAQIVQQGYDTDTVAAICGGILGARFGSAWIDSVRFMDRSTLSTYADALVSRAPLEPLDALLKREAEWTKEEKEYQRKLIA